MNSFTMFEYLDWRGDLSFDKAPFNDVDAAILARFSYEPFDGIVPEAFRRTIKLEKAAFEMLNLPDLTEHVLYPEEDVKLIQKMYASERFKHIKLSGFINDIDLEEQTQFSALVYDLGEANYYIAFRGTDSSIIGWKEDLNMGFEFPVPGQKRALKYFEAATARMKEGSFYVGGHSKGGNLAIYSSAFCSKPCQDKIVQIYNFDGPGFTEDILSTPEFKAIESRVITYVPQFSVVGMILEHIETYSVVKSNRTGIMQHEIASWELSKDGFVLLDNVDSGSKFVDNTIRDWLSTMSRDEREQFVDTLYHVLTGGESYTLNDFSENKLEALSLIMKNYSGVDDSTKKSVGDMIFRLIKSAGKAHRNKNK